MVVIIPLSWDFWRECVSEPDSAGPAPGMCSRTAAENTAVLLFPRHLPGVATATAVQRSRVETGEMSPPSHTRQPLCVAGPCLSCARNPGSCPELGELDECFRLPKSLSRVRWPC